MRREFKNRNFWVMLGVDALVVFFSYYFSYFLRFEGVISPKDLSNILQSIVWVVPIKLGCFFFFNLYSGLWRYTGIREMLDLVRACLTSSAIIIAVLLITVRFEGFPRSIFIIDFLLTLLLVGGLRITIRLYLANDPTTDLFSFGKKEKIKNTQLLIIGAGDAGEKVLREIHGTPSLGYEVVGFLDDNRGKQGKSIHGVPVLGDIDALDSLKVIFDEITIALPSARSHEMRRIINICTKSGKRFRTLPGLGELINGSVSIKALRDVDYQDLLSRPPVDLDIDKIQNLLTDKRILVTGAGGSIGSELCRQIIQFHPKQLILLDASETNLYEIQMELKHRFGSNHNVVILCDIKDKVCLGRIFDRYSPQMVYHAAAYKHVPMLELNPWQTIQNNLYGSQNVMQQCIQSKAEQFVLVSTDKAVRPTNVMGASKRICELLMQSLVGNGTVMMAVRFGNVVGSSGSVIPLFRDQIAMGGPVTVCHPEVMRYFMTIPEACQLILQSVTRGQDGEIFVLKMGTPVKIADMARDLIRLSGKEPDQDIEIVYTGLRPGEKLYEEITGQGEDLLPTDHDKITVIRPNNHWNDGAGGHDSQEAFCNWLNPIIQELYALAEKQDGCGIREKLKELVPDYTPQENECVL